MFEPKTRNLKLRWTGCCQIQTTICGMPDTDAVLRLMSMPSKIGFNNQSRYDDFQFIHGMTLDYGNFYFSF